MISTEHKHASILRAIADGHTIQFYFSGDWQDTEASDVLEDIANDSSGILALRVKPLTISLGGLEAPCGEKEAPEMGTQYFTLCGFAKNGVEELRWCDDGCDNNALNRGMLWLKEEDAVKAALAVEAVFHGAAA